MTTLSGLSPKNTFSSLIKVADRDLSELVHVESGGGVQTPLMVSETQVSINGITLPATGASAGKVLTVDASKLTASWQEPSSGTGGPVEVGPIWVSKQTYKVGFDLEDNLIIQHKLVTDGILNGGALSKIVLNANTDITFPQLEAGRQFMLILEQDATGGHSVTWPANVRWMEEFTPTITTTGGRSDVFSFTCDGTVWLGFLCGLDFHGV